MLTLIWSETALEDLDSIVAYIGERNGAAAIAMQERIETCAERLSLHPYMYRTGRIPGTREAVAHPNYILIYQVGIDAVEVLNVIHSRRQYPPENGQPT